MTNKFQIVRDYEMGAIKQFKPIQNIIDQMDISIEEYDIPIWGYYDLNKLSERIILGSCLTNQSVAKKYWVILHELAHATGHSSRLNRPYVAEHENNNPQSIEEILKGDGNNKEELTAFLIMELVLKETQAIPTMNETIVSSTFYYMQLVSNEDYELAAEDAQKGAEYLMEMV